MLALRLTTANGVEQVLPLQTELRVGRGPHNDVVLPDNGVSWSHVVFRAARGEVIVEDLGSRNGTFLDGERLAQPVPLALGAKVSVGESHFELHGVAAQPRSGVLFLEDCITGVNFPLREPGFVVGDADDADLRFSGPRMRIDVEAGVVSIDGAPLMLPWEGSLSGRQVRIDQERREWSPTMNEVPELLKRTLRVGLEPPMARIADLELDVSHVVRAPNRVTLLYFLAAALEADRRDGLPEDRCGWRTDEDVTIGVWGRGGLDSSRNRLNTLLYRLRAEIASSGLPEDLIAKDAGWTRLSAVNVDFEN